MQASTAPLIERLRVRIDALTSRERLFLMVGGATLLLFLLYLLWSPSEGEEVELAEATPVSVQPALAPPPPPAPVIAAPPPPQVDSNALTGLMLRGVMGGGLSGGAAIVSSGDGSQRVVRVGRELAPGLTLRAVGVNYAIASSGGGDIRLDLNKAGGVAVVAAVGAPVAAAQTPPSAGGTAAKQREALALRLGLTAQKVNGHTKGYAIRPGASVPLLQRAGLRPGDVLVSVNGELIDSEERLLDLPYQIGDSSRIEVEFERNGRRSKATVDR